MSVEGNVGNQYGIDGAKILVWGAVGDKLKSLDKNRMLALIQDDPDYFLSVIANIEVDELIAKLISLGEDCTDEEFKTIKAFIRRINKLDAVFMEATKFLHDSGDMLATGSFITGEFEQKRAILKTMGRVTDVRQSNQQDNGSDGKPKINVVPISS